MEKVVVGQILKAQGIKGELKVKPICDDPERFFDLKKVYADTDAGTSGRDAAAPFRVLSCRVAGGFVYLYLDKIIDRDRAEALSGHYLKIEREDVVLEEGRFLISEVVGSEVVFEDGEKLGVLEDILQTYAIDTYAVVTQKRERVLFPAVEKAIVSIDPEQRRITLCRKGFEEVACYED